MLRVCHPTAWLDLKIQRHSMSPSDFTIIVVTDLITVQSPELQLLLKEWATDVGRVVQLPGPVVVEDLAKDSGMPIEEVLV